MVRVLSCQCLYGYGLRSFCVCNRLFERNDNDGNSVRAFKILCLENVGQQWYKGFPWRYKAMKAIRLSFFQMALTMRRDMMLFMSCIAPILAGFFFRFAIPFLENVLTSCFHITAVISSYYRLVDIFFAVLSPVMFCFVSAMVSLEEIDENTAVYLSVTPLGKTGYLFARFGVPSVIAFLTTIILLPVFKLTALSAMTILLLAAGGTLQGMIVALLILTISSNKLEGIAVAKLSAPAAFGAAIPFFIKSDVQYVISPLPSFWIGKAVLENRMFYMLPAFILSVLWICFLLKRYLCKILL